MNILGTTGYIYASDGEKIDQDFPDNLAADCDSPQHKGSLHIKQDIIKQFSGNHAPKLVGIPKIFIIQACQGSKFEFIPKCCLILSKRRNHIILN